MLLRSEVIGLATACLVIAAAATASTPASAADAPAKTSRAIYRPNQVDRGKLEVLPAGVFGQESDTCPWKLFTELIWTVNT